MPTRKQIALIKVAANQLGLEDDVYRTVLRDHGGVESAKDLDYLGFDRVMKHFAACGFRSTWTRRSFGNRPGMASPAQVTLIRHLWREWSDTAADDDVGLNHWLESHFGFSALRFLDPGGAHAAITALKAMRDRKRAKAQRSPQEASTAP